MKVEKEKLELDFEPFNLIIAVETIEEAQALYAIFNLVKNNKLLGEASCSDIKSAIGCEHHVAVNDAIIANEVTYQEYYN